VREVTVLALKYLILLGLESEDLSSLASSLAVKGGAGVMALSLLAVELGLGSPL